MGEMAEIFFNSFVSVSHIRTEIVSRGKKATRARIRIESEYAGELRVIALTVGFLTSIALERPLH